MGRRQNKQLRQQAVKRAESYEEEQAKKVEASKAAKAAQGKHDISKWSARGNNSLFRDTVALFDKAVTVTMINPATGRKHHVTGAYSAVLSSSPGKAKGTPSNGATTSVLTEKLSAKKALASMKRERHVPITAAPRDSPKRYERKASVTKHSSPSSIASQNITGHIASAAIDVPVDHLSETNTTSPPATPCRTISGTAPIPEYQQTDVGSGNSYAASVATKTEQALATENKKSLFFTSFSDANASFTFGSPLLSSPPKEDGWKLFLNLPAAPPFTTTESVKQGPFVDGHQGRSIFDAIADRAKTEVFEADAPSTCGLEEDSVVSPQEPSPPCVGLAPTLPRVSHEVVRQACLTTPGDVINIALVAWIHSEVERLRRSEVEIKSCSEKVSVHPNTALTFYRPSVWNSSSKEEAPADPTSDARPATWSSTRMFFVDPSGIARLVDFAQTLYNVSVEVDDGASDFDSIASPHKPDMRLLQPLIYDETTSSEDSSVEADSDDLAEFEQYGCAFITEHSEKTERTASPATNITLSDDEDVIDSCLIFYATERTKTAEKEDVIVTERQIDQEGCEKTSTYEEDTVLPYIVSVQRDPASSAEEEGSMLESVAAEIAYESLHVQDKQQKEAPKPSDLIGDAGYETVDLLPVLLTTPYSTVAEDGDVIGSQPEDLTIDTPDFKTAISYCKNTDLQLKGDAVVTEKTDDPASRQAFPSDWASELRRTTLGTETLFTFFEHLETTNNNNTTTQSAIVTTFLKLVSMERKKLGEHPLPLSYTAESVIASKIVPHTIFLGTASLATFLAHFAFGSHDETTVDEVYRVFKTVSKEDMSLQLKATTGIMGALGVGMGRLPAPAME